MTVRHRDGAVLRQLRSLYNLGTIRDLSDGQLLERFATDVEEVAELAFSALVERHQAMVWRVCLAIVRDEHAAEDAFQATFLVLVRKARSLWVRDSLGPWLHQVACHTASCVRAKALRRRKHERRCAERDASRFVDIATPRDHELDAAIHEEVNRLPEKYRAVIVLCDLEGRTHQRAARFLAWPIGTVKSRQAHGRGLIRERLARRGFGLAVVGAIVDTMRQAAGASVRKEVSRNAVHAAMQQTARLLTSVGVSARVLTLTERVLRTMFWIRLRLVTVATLAVGVASSATGIYVSGSQEPVIKDQQQAANRPASTAAPDLKSKNTTKATAEPPAHAAARLRAQQLATRKAKALYEIAKLTSELAEIAVEEYEEVIVPRDMATVEGEIKLAESDRSRSADRVEWARRMKEKGYLVPSRLTSEELMLSKARFGLEQAESKKKVLIEYTKANTIKTLKSEVEKARSDEWAKQGAFDAERAKELVLERELRPDAD